MPETETNPSRKIKQRLLVFVVLAVVFLTTLIAGIILGDNADMAIEASTL